MPRLNAIIFLILFIGNVALAQEKKPKITFGIERGIEKNNNDFFFIGENENSNLRSDNTHNYWRVYVGIPFRFPKFKIDAGLGFSSNRFTRSLVLINGSFPGHEYSGIGVDYFLKIPLGIGEDRFDMGTEFRHQILMTRSGGGPGSFSSQFGGDGTVKNSYISLGAYAHYMVLRQDKEDLGLNASLGLSAFKYHDTFFQSSNLCFYINLGIVLYMYRSGNE